MNLWLAFIWFATCMIGLAVFVICRKRLADIAQWVRDECDHRASRILEAERAINTQLRVDFLEFHSPSDAVARFQKARAEIEGVPRTNPPWAWTQADLEFQRKQFEAEETSRRSRPAVLASVLGLLAVTVAAAVTTVVLTNATQPAVAMSTPTYSAPIAPAVDNNYIWPSPQPAIPSPPPPTALQGAFAQDGAATTVPPPATYGVGSTSNSGATRDPQDTTQVGAATVPATQRDNATAGAPTTVSTEVGKGSQTGSQGPRDDTLTTGGRP